MATTIEQQVTVDEALVPSAQRLRIGRSNFRLPSDIQSKKSTLQVVYDVLRRSPFFKAFLVTANVPEIYMQEFWATAKVHQHFIRFKMVTRKHIVDLKAFREMLHINPRVPGQSFAELPFEDEILEFLRFLGHSAQIKTLTDVNVNKLFQPWRSFAAVINKCLTGKSSGIDSGSASSTTPPTPIATPTPTTTVVAAPRLFAAAKGKQPARATSPTDLSDVERTEAEQLKIILRRSRQETHISQHGGFSTDEGTGSKPRVPDVPSDDSEEEISWNSFDDEDVDDQTKGRDDNEGEKTDESDDDQDKAEKVNDDDDDEEEISKIDEQEATESGEGDDEETKSDEESEEEETREKEEESFDSILRTPEESKDDGNGEEDQGLRISEEERMHEEEEADELYRDVDINQGRGLQVSQDIYDSHVTLTPIHSDGQQESSSTPLFVTRLLNPIIDPGMESIFTTGSSSITPIPSPKSTMTPSIITTTRTASRPPIPPTPIPSEVLQNLPKFESEMTEAVREAVQTQTDRLQDSIQRENDEFLKTIDDNMKKIINEQVKSQVKAQVTRILPRIEEFVNAQLEAKVLTRSSHSSRISYAVAADLSEMELKKILIDKMEGNKESTIMKRRREDDDDQEGPSAGSDRGLKDEEKVGSMHQPALHLNQLPRVQAGLLQGLNLDRCLPMSLLLQRNLCRLPVRWMNPHIRCLKQSWISILVKQTDARSSFNELLDTPIDFSNFIMNRLDVDTLTPELLAGPTYELMRGSCNSLTELEYHLEEVYKATTDQYRGRRVIPFTHFINNDHEYLRGGASSQKYTTSVTKTKAADYGHIKWIEDLVPRTMWIQEPLNYDKHALWGVSHWGQKRQQFYGFAVNRESALDVHYKRRIIAVTDLKIVEWHNYKHLDWISVPDLSEMELKKILIDKMEGNKSIQRSDEQRNLYKALVDAYEADKTILDSYGESTIMKRRRVDDDDQEGPSAGSDRGSKR
nr:hypothetical protein [Tanacetum cinerariifolium]